DSDDNLALYKNNTAVGFSSTNQQIVQNAMCSETNWLRNDTKEEIEEEYNYYSIWNPYSESIQAILYNIGTDEEWIADVNTIMDTLKLQENIGDYYNEADLGMSAAKIENIDLYREKLSTCMQDNILHEYEDGNSGYDNLYLFDQEKKKGAIKARTYDNAAHAIMEIVINQNDVTTQMTLLNAIIDALDNGTAADLYTALEKQGDYITNRLRNTDGVLLEDDYAESYLNVMLEGWKDVNSALYQYNSIYQMMEDGEITAELLDTYSNAFWDAHGYCTSEGSRRIEENHLWCSSMTNIDLILSENTPDANKLDALNALYTFMMSQSTVLAENFSDISSWDYSVIDNYLTWYQDSILAKRNDPAMDHNEGNTEFWYRYGIYEYYNNPKNYISTDTMKRACIEVLQSIIEVDNVLEEHTLVNSLMNAITEKDVASAYTTVQNMYEFASTHFTNTYTMLEEEYSEALMLEYLNWTNSDDPTFDFCKYYKTYQLMTDYHYTSDQKTIIENTFNNALYFLKADGRAEITNNYSNTAEKRVLIENLINAMPAITNIAGEGETAVYHWDNTNITNQEAVLAAAQAFVAGVDPGRYGYSELVIDGAYIMQIIDSIAQRMTFSGIYEDGTIDEVNYFWTNQNTMTPAKEKVIVQRSIGLLLWSLNNAQS
ncbi:MAG: hypothetical protein WBI07_13320, partial [Mobilitalea sp.]